MKLKVCGMTDVDQIRSLAKLGVDFAGMIFYKKSPRYVEGKILPSELQVISDRIKLTGVFVDEDLNFIKLKIKEYHLKAVQLCGSETPELCRELKEYAEVIKVVHVGSGEITQEQISNYAGETDFFLFDTQSEKYGGTGKKFDWNSLSATEISRPFFLSGGISIDDVGSINSFAHDNFIGIDINSRFEIGPGIKDINQIKNFISQLQGI